MMNNSNGFQNNSLLGSSTGFKKRNLLRPPSGMLNKKQDFLKAIDISQSEPAIATLLRSQVASIDEQINLLDKDKRIRQGQGGLQKGYVTALRKWLRQSQNFGEKQDQDIKILKHMGVDSYQSGFRKLWKIVGHLDLLINKVSQFQVVHFLLYDEMFDDIGKDSIKSSELLSRISNNGYNAGTFQISQILLDRQKDVFASSKKTGLNPTTFSKSKEQSKNRQQTNQLISDLKRENAKLNSMLEQLSLQRQNEKRRQQQKQNNNSKDTKEVKQISSTGNQINTLKIIKEIQQKYIEQIKYLTSEKSRAEENVVELKSKMASLQTQLKANIQSSKPEVGQKPKSGSYQEALVQQMQKMKRGFERKIAVLNEQYTSRERQLRKKQSEYKSQNQKIKWQKSLLLKKFQMMPLR